MEEMKKCPKCGGEMENGVLTNRNYPIPFKALNRQLVWGSKLIEKLIGPVTLEKETLVKTYKCKTCGYLESYAK